METDPNYEYDAPKWFDFTAENELNEDLSLDDLWFEREHPLHEPRDPTYHAATAKPLFAGCQGNTTESAKTKPQKKKPAKKDYNSKKSLGLKTIRTRRGQHENPGSTSVTGKKDGKPFVRNAEKQVLRKDGKKDSNGSREGDGRNTPDEIPHDENCNFTPPWTDSPLNETEEKPNERSWEGSNSSLNDEAVFSSQHAQLNHSAISPVRVRSLKSSSSSASPSPKTSLLYKAVSGARKQGPRRRRLLPTIPDGKTTNVEAAGIKGSPGLCTTQSPDGTCAKTESISQIVTSNNKASTKETLFADSMKPLRATGTRMNIGACNHPLPQHTSEFCREEKSTFGERSLCTIPVSTNGKENGNRAFASMECAKQKSFRGESGVISNDKSLEELLKIHNKKIVSARNQYDENGRRIKTAEPNFCPAPATSSASVKRSASTVDKSMVSAKQKRRSCVASVTNPQSEIAKTMNTHSTSSSTRTDVNKKSRDSKTQQTAKQKRRSCMASLENSELTNTVDRELRDLIAQHNSRVSAKKI